MGAWSADGLETLSMPIQDGAEEDRFLHCSSDRLRSTEYAGVWELIAYAPAPVPPPPPPPPPPLQLPPWSNPVLLALALITLTELVALLVAVCRTRQQRLARARGDVIGGMKDRPETPLPVTPPPKALMPPILSPRELRAGLALQARIDVLKIVGDKSDMKPQPVLPPWNSEGTATIQERILPMAGILPPARAQGGVATRARLKVQPAGGGGLAALAGAGSTVVAANRLSGAVQAPADGIQVRIIPLEPQPQSNPSPDPKPNPYPNPDP